MDGNHAIAQALAPGGPDEEERRRRRWQRIRVALRTLAVLCVLAAVALAALLLRPIPRQAELQYTQAKVRRAGWEGSYQRHFNVRLEDQTRVYEINPELAARGGRDPAQLLQPGTTVRIGYAGRAMLGRRYPAWELAVEERTVYDLADVRARAAREAPFRWFVTTMLLGAGALIWWLTPRPRRHRYRRRRQTRPAAPTA